MGAHSNGLAFAVAGRSRAGAQAVELDASDDLEIGYSASRLGPLIVAGFVMTLLSASLAFGWWNGIGEHQAEAGVAGVMLFGLATCCLIWMLPTERGPVVIVSRYGLRDLRIGNEFLLWDSIAEVSGLECRGRRVIVLTLTPALQRQLSCIKAKCAAPRTHAECEAPHSHVVISPQGLATDFDTLLQACRAFHGASDPHTALQQRHDREHTTASQTS
ncbi:hypothetical protein JQ596_34455 [Bradyrhizobium manausense]|uniref:STM3941 family protein n=1 Tax=Bradyrhizobium TaxID=374 RepID=UPI001BADB810|nr:MULTISPECIES: STM3941 family protein [Bradyrhizobium]MBR0830621.1 hypothetical protein [Bradyrhizobium manausense]UVO31007.1 hypothetical protein KUF59_10340 [Bradyrhizobium arachidis]